MIHFDLPDDVADHTHKALLRRHIQSRQASFEVSWPADWLPLFCEGSCHWSFAELSLS